MLLEINIIFLEKILYPFYIPSMPLFNFILTSLKENVDNLDWI